MQAHHHATPRLFIAAAICALLSLFLAPLAARAENAIVLQVPSEQLRNQPAPQVPAAKKARPGLSDVGNVTVHYNNWVSITFCYEAGGNSQESRIKVPPPRQEVASLGGLSVKFGVAF